MKFLRRTAGVTLRHKIKSEKITSEFGMTPIMKKSYRNKWRNHVEWKKGNKTAETGLPVKPVKKRSKRRPMTKLINTSDSSSKSFTPRQTG